MNLTIVVDRSGANTAIVFVLLLCMIAVCSDAAEEAQFPGGQDEVSQQDVSRATLKQLRKQAAHRPRRIIMNNDGNDTRWPVEGDLRNRETFLAKRTAPLLGSHVDAIFYGTGCSFNLYRHHSQETEPLKNAGDEEDWGWQLGLDGPDVLETMVDFGHQHGIEVFWSMRMNDTHDTKPKNAWCFSQWKKDRPQLLMGQPGQEFAYGRARWKGRWSALDYGQPEVRDKTFRILQDVATRYDVDGLELDFFRHPVFFRPQMTGDPVTQTHCDMMTGLVRRVRQMVDDVALGRERPMLIAVRVPDSFGYAKGIGLDIECWLQEELIDLLVVGGYFHLQPWEQTIAVGHRFNVPVYPCLSASRLSPDRFNNLNVTRLHGWRGEASRAWEAGANGIYVFNCFSPNDPIFRELGDPELLQSLDKDYQLNIGRLDHWLKDGSQFVKHPLP